MESIILKSILNINPEIERERAEAISSALTRQLTAKGLLSANDLKHVTLQHLQAENLNEFQALRLLDWWKSGRHLESDPKQSSTDMVVPIPWSFIWELDRMAKKDKGELAQALIVEKRRPSALAELLLINAMVGAAKTAFPSAKRDIMEHMANAVSAEYPLSFVDQVGDTVLNNKRFMKHCKDQHDNYVARPSKQRDRANRVDNTIINMPVKSVLGLSKESWHNTELPPGETEEQQEEMRLELIEYARRRKDKDPERITHCLESTYPSQRKVVLTMHKSIRDYQNKKKRKRTEDPEPEFTDIVNDWPYLFRASGLTCHFNKLYNINIDECFHLYFNYNFKEIFEYLVASNGVEGTQVKVCVEKAIEKGNDPVFTKLLGLITLLAKSFNESIKAFILNEEQTIRFEEVSELKALPSTPCIVVAGSNTFGAKKFYLCMDKFCFLATPSFKDAFRTAYSLFFVFHLDFPKKFGLVCEFIQREILNLNSDMGSKRAEATSSTPIPAKIVNLQRECAKYQRMVATAKASLE